jgi:hypothetical protein
MILDYKLNEYKIYFLLVSPFLQMNINTSIFRLLMRISSIMLLIEVMRSDMSRDGVSAIR